MKTTSTGRPLQNIKSWIFLPSLIRSFLSSFSFLSSTQSNYRSNCLKGGQEEHFVKCLPNNLKTKPDKGWFSPPSQTCRPCPGNKRGWNSVCNNNVNQMIIFWKELTIPTHHHPNSNPHILGESGFKSIPYLCAWEYQEHKGKYLKIVYISKNSNLRKLVKNFTQINKAKFRIGQDV